MIKYGISSGLGGFWSWADPDVSSNWYLNSCKILEVSPVHM